TTRLGGIDYRHVRLGQLKLEFVVAVEKKQAVLAVLPIDAGKNLLRTALGLDKPEHSLQDSGKLDKLIQSDGYQPYSLAYIDFTRLPALIAGEKDPLLKALLASAPAAAEKIPASCKADFDRIASRVPMISSGMTAMKADQVGYRINVALASDIASTFSGIHVKLPGLGGSLSAPLDLAIAFPVKEFRQFWMAQADAVAAKPFTCPALTHLNQGFAKLRMAVQKTAVPPVNDLRGLQISIDSIDLPDAGKPTVAGRVLIASDNPEGMIAMAQMAVPALRTLQIPKDGKPVALPATLTRMAGGQPAWVAMNDHVLALALGSGEDQRLAESLKSTSDVSGAVSNFHMDGSMYRKWLAILSKAMDTKMKTNLDSNAANDFMKNMQQMKAQAEHVDAINEDIHVDDHGVVMNVHVKRH
ncbi:hypothetical protein, partial [Oleiagrimonas sp.]|uniref:hypothetical protein n=1 Tax=Oleiagrimonas sp. TaxID=2010330 RepID=UPI00262D05D6